MKVGTGSGMTDEDKMQRAVALRAIAEQTKKLESEGATPPVSYTHLTLPTILLV